METMTRMGHDSLSQYPPGKGARWCPRNADVAELVLTCRLWGHKGRRALLVSYSTIDAQYDGLRVLAVKIEALESESHVL